MRKVASTKWENIKKRFYDILEKQIVEVRVKPYKIAMGCALGIGINFIPTFGIGFIFAFLLALLFRVNQAGAAAISLLTGPFVPLMYALNFVVGGLILTPAGEGSITEFIISQYTMLLQVGHLKGKIFGALEFLGPVFMLGAVVNAFIFGTGCYFLVMRILKKYEFKQT